MQSCNSCDMIHSVMNIVVASREIKSLFAKNKAISKNLLMALFLAHSLFLAYSTTNETINEGIIFVLGW